MEPYRPFVDLLVAEIAEREILPEDLEKRHKEELLKLLQSDVYIEGKTSPLMLALQTTATSLTRCFAGESRKLSYPILKL
jgi:CRISPR-associated protein Cas1